MCKSICTGIVSEFCCLGSIDFGQIYCMECNSCGTRAWEKRQLKLRFGESWESKYQELRNFARDVKRKVRTLRKTGHNPAETIYFIDPPLHPELHADHMNLAGEHIIRPKSLIKNPALEKLVNEMREKGRMLKKSYLTDFGSHG